jgi:hypothetical protein
MYSSYDSNIEKTREYRHRDPSRCPRNTLHLQKLALTLPTSGGCSVGIVCSQTQATTFSSLYENDNDSDRKANSTSSKSHSREPLTQELFSGSNSQPNNRSNNSEDGRIRNSVDSRGKAEHL